MPQYTPGFGPNQVARTFTRPAANRRMQMAAQRTAGSGLPANMTRGQIPFQAYQDWQRIQAQQEADRQKAIEMYGQAKQGLYNNPAWQQSWNQYQNVIGSGGPFNADYVARQEGALKNQAALGWQNQQQQMAEMLARRGLGGAPSQYQQQMGQQQAEANLANQYAGTEQWAAGANEQALATARQAQMQMAAEQAAQAAALDEAAAALVGGTEREMFPWESFLVDIEGRNRGIAGPKMGGNLFRRGTAFGPGGPV